MIDIGSVVRFHSLGGSDMENKFGDIVGVASRHEGNIFWIVKFRGKKPKSVGKASCVVMTDACLEDTGIKIT